MVRRANRVVKGLCDKHHVAPVVVSTGFVMHSGDVMLRCDSVPDVQKLMEMDKRARARAPGSYEGSWCEVFGQ